MSNVLEVLIVEDEPIIRVFLKRLVQGQGHKLVGAVSNATAALDIIANNTLDLIFMDINIEGSIDGISLVRKMRSVSEPLIYFISAYNDIATIEEALSTRAYSYITKPIKEEDVLIAFTVAKKRIKPVSENKVVILSPSLYYERVDANLYYENALVKLSRNEHALIALFIKHMNTNVSVETLQNTVWRGKAVSLSTIRGSIAGLRKKVPELRIENNVSRGYVLLSSQ